VSKSIDPEQPAFMRVPVKCIPTVVSALEAAGFASQAKDVAEFTRYYTDPVLNAEREEWVARADAEAREGEVEFDSDSTISGSDGGQYVLGWVWVDGPDASELDAGEMADEVLGELKDLEECLVSVRTWGSGEKFLCVETLGDRYAWTEDVGGRGDDVYSLCMGLADALREKGVPKVYLDKAEWEARLSSTGLPPA